MRFLRRLAPAFLSFLLVLPASPQQTTTAVQRDPQAVAILQASFLALGGISQPLPATLSITGTHINSQASPPTSYNIRLMTLGTDKVRWETDLTTGTVVSIIRGRGGWIQDTDGITTLSIGQTVGQGVENLPLLAIANWANLPSVLVTFVGPELLDGTNVLHISLTESRDPTASADSEKILRTVRQCELYIDQQTNLPIRLRYSESLGDWRHSIPVELAFSDYKSVNGLLFPFTLTRYRAGQMTSQTQLNSVVLNPPLTDDLFWVIQP